LRKISWNSLTKHRATLDALKAGKLTDEMDVIQTVAKEISAKYI
jgi:F-type H+-transporting ATPase subunit alpha